MHSKVETAVVEHVRSNPGIEIDDIVNAVSKNFPEQEVRDAIKNLRGKATGIVRNWGRYYLPGDPDSMKFKDQKRNIVRQIELRKKQIQASKSTNQHDIAIETMRLAELDWVLDLMAKNWPNEMFDMESDK